ncbi:MAG: Long-chain-fatty-acid--CoA ligase [Rhodanobacteraceae bacterium]|jgi:long-chain acyl-CoA synthetase|nr:MAG: Long-chain-fatty-acid--CoA ligase [Rhodanobacteraceae bacterium]
MADPRPWLAHYPPGVPAEIDANEFASIVAMFERACARHPQRPAYSSFGKVLSWAELDRQSAAFAAFLANEWKLGKGDRLAIMLPNLLQYPIALFGALRAGLTVVNVNPLYTARELQHQLEDSGARAIVVLENFASTLQEAIGKTHVQHVMVTSIGDQLGFPKGPLISFAVKHLKKMVPAWSLPGHLCFGDVLRRGARMQAPKVQLGHDDIAFLQYTGGTTGVAKGAMLTHGNMVANTLQLAVWVGDLFTQGEEQIITALPLYHIFSLTVNAILMAYFGGENVLITNPRDIPAFIKTLKQSRWSAITGVNTLYNALVNHPEFASVDCSRVKFALAGGMAVQRAVAEHWKKATGIPLIEGYGLTETSPVATANRLDVKDYNGSIGMPLPSTDLVLRDDSGHDVALGESGELCVRGPQVMKGYWQRPEETAKVLDADGWLRTGDIARMDEKGLFYIVDRKKDMILVSGFNVYPNEVEDVVAHHPGVLEVAAIGVPDEHSGEVVKLFVVKKDPALTEAALKQYCHDELTGYKRPKYIEFRTELPKSNVGKILRRALRDEEKKRAQN